MASRILELIRNAQELADKEEGIKNILQPGIIKELIIADMLGHKLIPDKHLSDAMDSEGNFYEYLASINRRNVKTNKGSSFQIDRITTRNLERIKRNKAFYFAFFSDHLTVEAIYKVETKKVLDEAIRQLSSCKNTIAHVNFLTKWVKTNGLKVHPK